MFGPDQAAKLRERGIIEVAPLAYMRGRTLNNSMIIIDESQNATLPILKMALTRIGVGSKMILTGSVPPVCCQADGEGFWLMMELSKGKVVITDTNWNIIK